MPNGSNPFKIPVDYKYIIILLSMCKIVYSYETN